MKKYTLIILFLILLVSTAWYFSKPIVVFKEESQMRYKKECENIEDGKKGIYCLERHVINFHTGELKKYLLSLAKKNDDEARILLLAEYGEAKTEKEKNNSISKQEFEQLIKEGLNDPKNSEFYNEKYKGYLN